MNYKMSEVSTHLNETTEAKLIIENSNFSIIFDTVENRKKQHDMQRKHNPNLTIEKTNGKRG